MDITPHVNLLKSIRAERVDHLLLFGEAIDNSFDAGASVVAISVSKDAIVIKDDGVGITPDRISSFFSLGDHSRQETTKLGRFGIGIKTQAANAGDVTLVQSTYEDGQLSVRVNWAEVLALGRWQIDDPKIKPRPFDAVTGTRIQITHLRRPQKYKIEDVHHDLALRFHPALAGGKRISLNDVQIEAIPEPEMTDVVEAYLDLSGGRSARVRGGILVDASVNKLRRVHIAYEHRVIMPDVPFGCGAYGGLNKMFARVHLFGRWHLGRFKDDLTDEDERRELENEIERVLTPILRKVNADSMTARLAQLSRRLNDSIADEHKPSRRPNRSAMVKPAAEEKQQRKRQRGHVDDDKSEAGGPASRKNSRDELLITLDAGAEEFGIGYAEVSGRRYRVNLSSDDPFIATLIARRDQRAAERTMLAIAYLLFETTRDWVSPRGREMLHVGRRVSNSLALEQGEREAA